MPVTTALFLTSLRHITTHITTRREAVRLAQQQIAEQAVAVRELNREQDEVVQPDIGGTVFHTTEGTMRRGGQSMMWTVIRRVFADERDAKGYFFFDRDPSYLALILEWLRSGEIYVGEGVMGGRECEVRSLYREAYYFHFEELEGKVKEEVRWYGRRVVFDRVSEGVIVGEDGRVVRYERDPRWRCGGGICSDQNSNKKGTILWIPQ